MGLDGKIDRLPARTGAEDVRREGSRERLAPVAVIDPDIGEPRPTRATPGPRRSPARATISGAMSIPWPSSPAPRRTSSKAPVPQPRSSTRAPGPKRRSSSSTIAAHMGELIDERLDRSIDLVWAVQQVCTQALLPVVVDGLPPADRERILRDQDCKLARLVRTALRADPPAGLGCAADRRARAAFARAAPWHPFRVGAGDSPFRQGGAAHLEPAGVHDPARAHPHRARAGDPRSGRPVSPERNFRPCPSSIGS